ncbi:MAG: hypothetical protein HKN24_13005, partial [Acidimicrobiales bacterium]|nr:hypothetical protein [Acidimicrobiales bacterium]
IDESGTGLIIFTITHMLRARLHRVLPNEIVDDVIEGTRANLGRLVGHALRELPGHTHDQRAFAEPAAEVARLVGELIGDAAPADRSGGSTGVPNRLLVPVGWGALETELALADVGSGMPVAGSGYRIYSTTNDIEVAGHDLYRSVALRRLRRDLDRACAEQAVSAARVAQRVSPVFLRPTEGGLLGGQDHGRIDRARLAQIVADPLNPFVHSLPVPRRGSDAVVTFLVDTTGSMKVQQYESVAVLCDTFVRALEMIDVRTEVLGFSTATWAGGESARRWTDEGSPPDPGRLADVMHVVYKSFDQTWRQARASLAAMLRLDHYREGVDGEAIEWAIRRLDRIDSSHRYLVLISDGFPMEAMTATHNRDDYLLDHMQSVVDRLSGRSDVRLGAVSVDQRLEEIIINSTTADLSGTLTLGSYDLMNRLFG